MNTYNYYGQVWEYLLLISPPEDVKHSIGIIKKEVGIKFGSSHALHSIAYISLIKFLQVKGYERKLLSQLFGFCLNKLPVEVSLKNFGVFPRHTLYVDIQENSGLKKMVSRLMVLLMNSNSARSRHIKPSKKFYMTIARNLNPAQFESVSNEYRSRKISNSFLAKNVVLLKRPYNEYNAKGSIWSGRHNFMMGC